MTATRKDIEEWIVEAQQKGASHLIVMHDTFDHENYPVLVMPHESAREVAQRASAHSMQKIEECYSMARDIPSQLAEHRAVHYDS